MKFQETDVTLLLAESLKTANWEILSVNNPYAGKSVWIKPTNGYRGKGAIIPDIIARKEKFYLFIESYSGFKKTDIVKLLKLDQPEYYNAILNLFNEKEIELLKALAYPGSRRDYQYPSDIIIFLLNPHKKFVTWINKDNKKKAAIEELFK